MPSGICAPGQTESSLLSLLQSIAAPGAMFTRSGNVSNAYLEVGTVRTNLTGFPIRLNSASLVFISASNSNSTATFDVDIIEWDGISENILATLSVVSSSGDDYTPPTPISITYGNELRAYVKNGASTNPVVIAFTSGEVPL